MKFTLMQWFSSCALLSVAGLLTVAGSFCLAPCAMADDIVSKALMDELKRSVKELRINGKSAPYFVQYRLFDDRQYIVAASLGALTCEYETENRTVEPEIRVGNYDLDNTNFVGTLSTSNDTTVLPVDDDYDVLRRVLWLDTDIRYTSAVENFNEKLALLSANGMNSRVPDFSRAPALIVQKEAPEFKVDKERWNNSCRQLSAVFRDFPPVEWSYVMLEAAQRVERITTSEGSDTKAPYVNAWHTIAACAQAADGEYVWDMQRHHAVAADELPGKEVLEAATRDVASNVIGLAKAEKAVDYVGPVLFEGDAAGYFFETTLGQNLLTLRDSDSTEEKPEAIEPVFMDRIGMRILPVFMNVVDDPYLDSYAGVKLQLPLFADGDAVKPEKLQLVENGILKTLCSSRTPTRVNKVSNGHFFGNGLSTTVLHISSTKSLSRRLLYERLRQLGLKQGLEYVIVVKRFADFPASMGVIDKAPDKKDSFERTSVKLKPPTLVYKVSVKTGKEELLRGADLSPVPFRVLRNIVATGRDPVIYYVGMHANDTRVVICPSFIIDELEIEPDKQSLNSLPVLPSPLTEYAGAKK